ncbi:hypothetical protein L1S32_11390 [Methanogenium sp. S4BF]|uniref:cell envelope integrity protein TolA n=1 Tax=Methanogenium sp. S4BF TaxID=1789226 RepID=UPI00241643E4|nr:cell envelope integrity protein TolA [Methanogenium sp. S4BF]WFN34427.1 hypothetical protein L1S32_11390 [Methanogenium sp. S4BF]
MSPEPDDRTIHDASEEGIRKKADASVVLTQLRGNKTRENTVSENPDGENGRGEEGPSLHTDEVLRPADITPDNEMLPDTDEIRRKLEDEDADRKIREQLASAQVWEEKQKAIENERERQRKEIEREIEADSRKKAIGKWKRNAVIGAVLLILIIAAAALTFSVQPNLPATQDSFPYVSSYNVRIPQGEPVNFAGIPVTVSGTGDKVIVSISGGMGTEIGIGDKITLSSPKRMVIRIFGVTLFESDYQIVAKFRGYVPVTSQNDFIVAVMTTRPVPEWAVGVILPDGVDITPVGGEDF